MNQEHSKKPGANAGEYPTQPSRAPRQDEADAERPVGEPGQSTHAYHPDDSQGISNRPSKEEHAFPEPPATSEEERGDVVLTDPVQTGGSRGGV
jgi:hypothetical protein